MKVLNMKHERRRRQVCLASERRSGEAAAKRRRSGDNQIASPRNNLRSAPTYLNKLEASVKPIGADFRARKTARIP